MREGYINVPFEVVYDTEGTQVGLTDLTVSVYDPANNNNPANDFILTEIGTTGVYKGTFTPTVVGVHTIIVNSAASNPIIQDKASTVNVNQFGQSDLSGAGFISSTDSQEAISNKLDSVLAGINAPSARGGLI